MPGFISHVRGTGVPIIDLHIAFPKNQWTDPGDPLSIPVKALVDTGATHVVINPPIVQQLCLPHVGTIDQTVVGGTVLVSRTYRCDVVFHGLRAMSPHIPYVYTVHDALALDTPLVGYDVIIGWDVMAGIDLTFRRDNSLSLHLP